MEEKIYSMFATIVKNLVAIIAALYQLCKETGKEWWKGCSKRFKDCAIFGFVCGVVFCFILLSGEETSHTLPVLLEMLWHIVKAISLGSILCAATTCAAYIISLFIPEKTWERIKRFCAPELND
jgi:hypothetical protein